MVRRHRGGSRPPQYVQRIDSIPMHMTTNRKLALVMGDGGILAEELSRKDQKAEKVGRAGEG
jgi:hypothetical protein